MENYEKQANDVLNKFKIKFDAKYTGYKKHFVDDKEKRFRFDCTFTKENGKHLSYRVWVKY